MGTAALGCPAERNEAAGSRNRSEQIGVKRMKSKPKGMGLGIALGAALGIVLGVMAGHVALWLGIGMAIGIAIGGSVRRKGIECPHCAAVRHEHEARELTQQAKS